MGMNCAEDSFNMGRLYNYRRHSKLVSFQIPNTYIRAYLCWSCPPGHLSLMNQPCEGQSLNKSMVSSVSKRYMRVVIGTARLVVCLSEYLCLHSVYCISSMSMIAA